MNITQRQVDSCIVVDLQDDLFEYPKTQVLKNHVIHLIEAGCPYLVLNLSHVNRLDSFGLAVFISILKLCKAHQGNLALFGLNETVTKLIEITRLDRVLDIWETEAQALYHVRPSKKKNAIPGKIPKP